MSITRATAGQAILMLLLLAGGTLVPGEASAESIDLCHVTPGDAGQRRVIRVSPSSSARHVERHGDTPYSAVEECNGQDDDCDGRVDESFHALGRSCFEGSGVCAAEGRIACDPLDASRTHCDALPLPPLEPGEERTCSGGLDEDCDGLVDGDDPDCAFDIGRELPSNVDLPITIDCCAVSGPQCIGPDYCELVEEPINPCPLSTGEVVSCLELEVRPEQNACWSALDGGDRVSVVNLIGLLESAPVAARREPVFVDNGEKLPVYSRMRDRMLGEGRYLGDPAGVDRYPEAPGIDSWVVRLPVVECQASEHCAGADPQEIVGALCFEVREISIVPDPLVRGRFLCPERDPGLFEECELGPDFVD